MSRHRIRKAILVMLLLASLAALAGYAWIRAPFRGFSGPSATVEFPIGTSTRAIFRQLERAGIVRNSALAEIYYRLFYRNEPLRAGEYAFSGPQPLDRVILTIIWGEVVRHTVVVPEGLTNEESFSLFLQQRVGSAQGFRRAASDAVKLLPWATPDTPDLEGFLFPDTYVATRSTPTREIVTRMLENFERHFSPEMQKEAEALGLSVRRVVTIASLVEKETSLRSERPHVAAVYLNRLRLGMRLQCDPTVIYALQKAGMWSGRLHRSDLEFDSPYNTYLNSGLPPGPICNPGVASLRAALEPMVSDDLYFVARGDGGHYFSKTYADHLLMIDKSRANSAAAGEADSR
ncbi:MAG: endolytic transglycosylase MltG [Thermoanaerobaculia bacterium]